MYEWKVLEDMEIDVSWAAIRVRNNPSVKCLIPRSKIYSYIYG